MIVLVEAKNMKYKNLILSAKNLIFKNIDQSILNDNEVLVIIKAISINPVNFKIRSAEKG